jgi:hypothetical protein
MNPVGEGGNQSSITAPVSVADVPPAIVGMEPTNQPVDPAASKIPGIDPSAVSSAESKLNNSEKNVLDALNTAASTVSSPGVLKEDPPKSPVEDYLAKFGDKPNQISEEPRIDLSPESPTLTNVNQPLTEASPDAASPNPVTLNDLLTRGPQAAFDEPTQATPTAETAPQQENVSATGDNAIPVAEVMPKAEKTPKEEIMEEFSKILDNYSVEKATQKAPAA